MSTFHKTWTFLPRTIFPCQHISILNLSRQPAQQSQSEPYALTHCRPSKVFSNFQAKLSHGQAPPRRNPSPPEYPFLAASTPLNSASWYLHQSPEPSRDPFPASHSTHLPHTPCVSYRTGWIHPADPPRMRRLCLRTIQPGHDDPPAEHPGRHSPAQCPAHR